MTSNDLLPFTAQRQIRGTSHKLAASICSVSKSRLYLATWCMCLDVPLPWCATSVIHTLPLLITFASAANAKQGCDVFTVVCTQRNAPPLVEHLTFLSQWQISEENSPTFFFFFFFKDRTDLTSSSWYVLSEEKQPGNKMMPIKRF